MIEYTQAKRFIDGLSWPDGSRPLLALSHEGVTAGGMRAYVARLYRPEDRFADIVQMAGPTPEGALRLALVGWVASYALPPELVAGFARLLN